MQKRIENLKVKLYRLVRWSEKYTKTDMAYLAKGGFWLMVGHSISTLSGLTLAIGFANLVSKDIYGNYKFIFTLAAIIGAFSLTGMRTAITLAVALGFDGALRAGFWTHLKWSIGMVFVSLLGATYYFIHNNYTLALSLLIIGSCSPFLTSASLYGSFLHGKKDFKTASVYGIFRNTVPALLLLITIVLTSNLILIVLVSLLSNTGGAIFFYLKTLRKYKPSKKTDPAIVHYSKHLSALSIINALASHLDKVLIFHYLGAAHLAIYAFALIIPTQLRGINKILGTLALPKLSKRNIPELKKTIPAKALKLFLAVLPFVLIYIILAPLIFRVIFPHYLESIYFSQIFVLNLIFLPAILFGHTLLAHRKTRQLYILSTITSATKIILLLILLPFYGIWGAISAHLLSQTIRFFILFILFKKL